MKTKRTVPYQFSIPEDIAILWFNEGVISSYSKHKWKRISKHAKTIGGEATTILIDLLENCLSPNKTITKVMSCFLIERESS